MKYSSSTSGGLFHLNLSIHLPLAGPYWWAYSLATAFLFLYFHKVLPCLRFLLRAGGTSEWAHEKDTWTEPASPYAGDNTRSFFSARLFWNIDLWLSCNLEYMEPTTYWNTDNMGVYIYTHCYKYKSKIFLFFNLFIFNCKIKMNRIGLLVLVSKALCSYAQGRVRLWQINIFYVSVVISLL